MMFYNITNNVVAIDPNQYVSHQQKITRVHQQTAVPNLQHFPQTIRIWNSLPASIVVPGQSFDQFKTLIQGYKV